MDSDRVEFKYYMKINEACKNGDIDTFKTTIYQLHDYVGHKMALMYVLTSNFFVLCIENGHYDIFVWLFDFIKMFGVWHLKNNGYLCRLACHYERLDIVKYMFEFMEYFNPEEHTEYMSIFFYYLDGIKNRNTDIVNYIIQILLIYKPDTINYIEI